MPLKKFVHVTFNIIRPIKSYPLTAINQYFIYSTYMYAYIKFAKLCILYMYIHKIMATKVKESHTRAYPVHNNIHVHVVSYLYLAKSGVMKQARPLRARLESYWLWLEMSLRIMLVVSITTSKLSWKH